MEDQIEVADTIYPKGAVRPAGEAQGNVGVIRPHFQVASLLLEMEDVAHVEPEGRKN